MQPLIELRLYAETIDFFAAAESDGYRYGAREAALEWAQERGLDSDDREYVLAGVDRLTGGGGQSEWADAETSYRLDTLVWTFHRAWVDRYGWVRSMPKRDE